MTYMNSETSFEGVIACADIGGTNFRLALVRVQSGCFRLLHKETHATREMRDPSSFLLELFGRWEHEFSLHIDGLGLAVAGPVTGQICRMTNADLELDAESIANALGKPVWLLNDLAGITWGVSLIDHDDNSGLIHLGGPDAASRDTRVVRKSVVAPGTGLGVGLLVVKQGITAVLDTEAGHTDFVPHGDEAVQFHQFMLSRYQENPGYEQFVSGRGFEHLFEFYTERRPNTESPAMAALEACHDGSKGALISRHAETDEHCRAMMGQFIDMLARFCSTIALTTLPRNGLYLAGGIPGKNIPWFTRDGRFMRIFVRNYMPSIAALLESIPVYLVDDGDIGLYGAAWACIVENSL